MNCKLTNAWEFTMKTVSVWTMFFIIVCLAFGLFLGGCSCDDDDDDDSGDDVADDDDDDDDNDSGNDDDASDDDAGDDDAPFDCIPPVDYDGDGDRELLMVVDLPIHGVTQIYLVEPGTFERGDPLLHYGSEVENVQFSVADFDGNDVWDVLVARTMPNGLSYDAYYDLYLNGDFSAPAHNVGPFADTWAYAELMDADDNGRPEALVDTTGISKLPTHSQWSLIDADGDFSEIASITVPIEEDVEFLPEPRTDSPWRTIGNVTGAAGTKELMAFVTYASSGSQYGRFRAYNLGDGSVAAESDEYYLGDDANYSSGYAADVDGDGQTEAVFAHTVYSLVPEPTASFKILGGPNLAPEWQSADFNGRQAYAEADWDFNRDGTIDVLFEHTDPTVSLRDYTAVVGVGDYQEIFGYDTPADAPAYPTGLLGRGWIESAYNYRGLGDEILLHETTDDGSTLKHGFRAVNIDDGSMTGMLWEDDLGEQAWTSVRVLDLGRDGIQDLMLLANKQTWNGTGWENHFEWSLLSAPDFTNAFYIGLDNAYTYNDLWGAAMDLTGDLAPDVVLQRYHGATSHWDYIVYECDSLGCQPGTVIDYEANETFRFIGPFL